MQRDPADPCKDPLQPDPDRHLKHRSAATDGGHGAFVVVMEGLGLKSAMQPRDLTRIDGVADAAFRGAADAAVVRPRGGVHRHRQRVDVRVGDDRAAGVGTLVAVVGDGEQHAQVREGPEQDHAAEQHVSPAIARR